MLRFGIIGQAARGESYLSRPQIRERIIGHLNQGSNVLLVAPRRVGKTSTLFDLIDRPFNSAVVTYYTSESVNSENEYYQKLFGHILECLKTTTKFTRRGLAIAKDALSRVEEIGLEGNVKIGKSKIVYYKELSRLLVSLDLHNTKLVVLNDELSSTVENIMRDEGNPAAIHFLETLREIRQLPDLHKKVQFVFAGSIGLENVVSKLDSINLINDLVPVNILPLSSTEARELTNRILGDITEITPEGFEHLLHVIEWWIPFYFQILLDEAYNILGETQANTINKQVIDDAVKKALKHRLYFEHWFTRLRKAYEGDEFSFIKDVLNLASENRKATSAEIVNLATAYRLETTYKYLMNALIHDGYLNNEEDLKVYRFNSPLLREWWRCNIAN